MEEYGAIVGNSAFLSEQLEYIGQIARTNTEVLITGETGVGKELFARAIHERSGRGEQPFMALNCAAMAEDFFERPMNEVVASETGALVGTLFLDDIGDLSQNLQAGLLNVIQEKAQGAPDVRVLAGTHINMQRAVDMGKFRSDLFYRLNEICISIKPLRERREDIALLVDHFLKLFNARYKKHIRKVSDAAMSFLLRYNFPGNVRELRNMIQTAVLFNDKDIIWIEDLPLEIVTRHTSSETPHELLSLRHVEKKHINSVLEYTGWNVSRAARILGITRATLYEKIKTYSLVRP